VATTPTVSAVAAIVTDGSNVIWADTGFGQLLQIPATGGSVITLGTGGVGSGLALGSGVLIYGDGTNLSKAQVGAANSGSGLDTGNIPYSTINPSGSIYWFDTFSSGWKVVEQPVNGSPGGNHGVLKGPLVADSSYAFCLDGSGQLFREVPGTNQWTALANASGTNLAAAGGYVYWLDPSDVIYRVPEGATPLASPQMIMSNMTLFATDGAKIYYPDGSFMRSIPAGGGSPTTLASISGCSTIAVSGSLIVWASGSTIWARNLP
jgi:hypothetical protein